MAELFSSSLLTGPRRLRQERQRLVEMRRIGARARLELLRAATEYFRGVQIAVRIGREFVDGPEEARRGAVGAPRIKQVTLQVVLEELVERPREDPQEPIVA